MYKQVFMECYGALCGGEFVWIYGSKFDKKKLVKYQYDLFQDTTNDRQ